MEDSKRLLEQVVGHPFDNDHCFACGIALTAENRTDEHIVPQWVLHRFELWDKQLFLPNGTGLPYKQARVPCCNRCNNEHLGRVERVVEKAVAEGPRAVERLPPIVLFVWAAKIHFAFQYKDCLLLQDRAVPAAGTILTRDAMDRISILHHLLQFARGDLTKADGPLIFGTLLIYEAQVPTAVGLQFDMIDLIEPYILAIRMGAVALFVAFRDGGVIGTSLPSVWRAYRFLRLHPLQVVEMVAVFATLSYLQVRPPVYLTQATESTWAVFQMPDPSYDGPVLRPWDIELYLQVFAQLNEVPLSRVRGDSEGTQMSFLHRGSLDELLEIDVEEFPVARMAQMSPPSGS